MQFTGFDEKKRQHSLRELVYSIRQLGVEVVGDAHGLAIDKAHAFVDWEDVLASPHLTAETLKDMQRGILPLSRRRCRKHSPTGWTACASASAWISSRRE